MWCQGSRYASVRSTATMTHGVRRLRSLDLRPHREAHRVPRHWRKRHNRQWYAAWLQHPVHRTLVVLAAVLLVVSAPEAVTVGTGVDECVKAGAR